MKIFLSKKDAFVLLFQRHLTTKWYLCTVFMMYKEVHSPNPRKYVEALINL